jgi:HK97 family phage portal protein
MGLLFNFAKEEAQHIEAALEPFNIPDFNRYPFMGDYSNTTSNRIEAMSVPAVARARNIICGTIGSLPVELKTRDNSIVLTPRFFEQPDLRIPGSVVYAYTAEDLLFHGQAYWQILSYDETTQRPNQVQWIAWAKVTEELDITGTIVIGYMVDGLKVPMQGVGSLIAFTGLDEGLLHRAGRTIKTAAALEKAVLNYAKEPVPSVVLKSTNPLSKERVTAMLDTWRKARQERSTAFLNDQIEMQQIGFNSQELQMAEARNHIVSEIARATGIPEWYLGAPTGSMTYANVSDERKSLIDFSMRPIITAIEQRLSMDDLSLRGYRVRFNFDDFLRGNSLERADVYSKLIPLGVMTVEEARRREDLV